MITRYASQRFLVVMGNLIAPAKAESRAIAVDKVRRTMARVLDTIPVSDGYTNSTYKIHAIFQYIYIIFNMILGIVCTWQE